HTRCPRDWSSDVCSSDLGPESGSRRKPSTHAIDTVDGDRGPYCLCAECKSDGCRAMCRSHFHIIPTADLAGKPPERFVNRLRQRSEERRVGKGRRLQGSV